MKKFDDIIIGFGKGGKTLAGQLASEGRQVALIERSSKMYGGTCINVGCIPSKSLIHSAAMSAASAAQSSDSFEAKAVRYADAIKEKRRLVEMLRKKNYDKLNNNENVTIINGTASFIDKNTVRVKGASKALTLSADNIFINTGSTPVLPKTPGADNNPHVYYSESLMELDRLPAKLAIIGGGYVGLEFASMYAAFGSEVTVFQRGDVFIPREDDDIAAVIRELLEAQGVTFKLASEIESISESGTVSYNQSEKQHSYEADAVLIATGRRANTDELNAEAVGIELTPRGAIVVDEYLQTTQENIWAMGDVTGKLQFTYTSLDDYRIVSNRLRKTKDYSLNERKNVPYCVFMHTPFARVGLNEREARKEGYDVRVVKLPAAAIPKAQVIQTPAGLLKGIVDNQTGKILGAMLLCEESHEMINTVKLAMDYNADYTVLRDRIFTHPTMSEALNDLFAL